MISRLVRPTAALARLCPATAAQQTVVQQATALRLQAAQSAATARRFCAQAAPLGTSLGGEGASARRASARRGPGYGEIFARAGAVLSLGAGAAYGLSSDAREYIDYLGGELVEMFEDFNESSREFGDSIADRIVSKPKGPWLLDLETMKYPENIPTLVLDLDKVILKMEHESRAGWRVIKRPFADQFFKEISHYYEVVLFSDDVFPVALDIATKWNLPVTGVLHRDFCKKKRNCYVKDLSQLGRRMDRVLMIDHDPMAFQLQPENGLLIRPFDGDTSDSELADLLEFLKAAATSNTDIRQFVQKFGGGDQDIGRRYLLHKKEQDQAVEKRRSVGRMFSTAKTNSFPGGPGMNNFSASSFR